MKITIWSLDIYDTETYILLHQFFFLTKRVAKRFKEKHKIKFNECYTILGKVEVNLW